MAGPASEYHHGEMPIAEQKSTWESFMKATWWASCHIAMVLIVITLHFAVGMSWWLALGIGVVVGIGGGLFLGLGAAWIATVIGTAVLGVIVGLLMMLAGAAS
ncbi:MAG: aa3-type cytochrome c oxidase subunit IV [Caulobacterales bacterium]